jgi:chemotaxis protein histidine kinase CheA
MRRWTPATWRPRQGVLHGLRGSAAHLGATELMQLCATLEDAADAGRLAECAPRCPRSRPCSARFERQSA